jgi:hypothetical protein
MTLDDEDRGAEPSYDERSEDDGRSSLFDEDEEEREDYDGSDGDSDGSGERSDADEEARTHYWPSSRGAAVEPLWRRVSRGAHWALEARGTQLLLFVLTIYILFANDVKEIAFTASSDPVFDVLSSVCLFSFCAELLMRCAFETRVERRPASWSRFAIGGYAFSFLFWLDLVAIVSLLPEINWIWSAFNVGTGLTVQLSAARGSQSG